MTTANTLRTLVIVGAMAALAACGGASQPGAKSAGGGWNATDACSLLDKAKTEAALGTQITGQQLSGVTEAKGGMAALSTCTLTLANGASLGLLAREAPDGDSTPQAIEQARSGGGITPPATDVPGLGKAALWIKEMNSLQVFIDDRRYVAINLSTPPAGSDPQAILTAVAKTLI